MIKKLGKVGLLVVMFFVVAGCSMRVLDFTIVSSKNVEMRIPDSSKGERVVGVDKVTNILGIPLGSANLKEAVDRAIEKAGPGYDALVDGVIYSIFNYYLLFATVGYKVEGTPVKTKDIITSDIADGRILYHSSLGIDNTKALKVMPVVVDSQDKK